MTDNQYTEWLQSEAKYCADRACHIKDTSKKQYWIGRQQAYENSLERYEQLTNRTDSGRVTKTKRIT